MYLVSRFVYECFNNNFIDKGLDIDHINGNKEDNRIENLQMITHRDNILKRTKRETPYSKAKQIKAININTGEESYYNSMSSCGKILNIVCISICRAAQGIQKTAISKNDGIHYKFNFITKDEFEKNKK